MLNEMITIAKNKLAHTNEIVNGLPAPQVTVLLTDNNNIYSVVNDVDGKICEELRAKADTKVVKMLTMWRDGQLDLSSFKFRNALLEINEQNVNTDIILQGKEGYLIKRLGAL